MFILIAFSLLLHVLVWFWDLSLALSMATAESIIAELQDAARFMVQRRSMPGALDSVASMQDAICKSIGKMIGTLQGRLSASNGVSILHAIDASPFTDEQKNALSTAVQNKVTAAQTQPAAAGLAGHAKQTFATQTAHLNYFTKEDWEILNNTDTSPDDMTKIIAVRDRLMAGGIIRLNEKCYADIVTTLWCPQWPQQHQFVDEEFCYGLYEHVHLLASAFADADPTEAQQLPILHTFPESPSQLPQENYLAMYGDGDGPVSVTIKGWQFRRAKVSCRASNKSIRQKAAGRNQQALASATPLSPQMAGSPQMMQQCVSMLCGALMGMQPAAGNGDVPEVRIFGKNIKRTRTHQDLDEIDAHSSSSQMSPMPLPAPDAPQTNAGASPEPSPMKPDAAAHARATETAKPGVWAALSEYAPKKQPAPAAAALEEAVALAGQVADESPTAGQVVEPKSAAADLAEMERQHIEILQRAKDKNVKQTISKRPAANVQPYKGRISAPEVGETTSWRGAKIQSSASKEAWRVWLDPTKVAREKQIKWGEDKKKSWSSVLKYVEDNNND